ncbi:MAG: glycosyltransferase family 4 protein [Myxococcales bacterium]|nr:glycosyltransferase family 4 protein [Myxococcales bacterium]
MLLALTSLLGAPGGIPSFNRLLCRAAAEFAVSTGQRLSVLALTDQPGSEPGFVQSLPQTTQPPTYQAFAGDKLRFASSVLRHVGRAQPVVLGHVNLSPLGLPFGRFGVIAHGTDVWTALPRYRRWALGQAHVAAGVSEHTLAQLCQVQGVFVGHCQRLINALDEQSLTLAQQNPSTADEQSQRLRLLSITRLHPDEPKGIDLVIRSLPTLPLVDYDVVGEGDAQPQLQKLAHELGVADRVHFLGRLSEAAKHAALARCHALVLPSSNEGFGIVYLEAMAHQKPCLAARVGGAPEVVLDEETGLVTEPAWQAVRDGILRLHDATLRQRLGRAGQRRLLQHFTYPAFARHAFALFSRLC